MPVAKHPSGKVLLSYGHRRAMCEAMARPFAPRVRVSDVELREGGSGYTYDALVCLKKIHPTRSFALIIGTDIESTIRRWHRADELAALVEIVVIGRQGTVSGGPAKDIMLPAVSSSEIRERLSRGASVDGLVPCSVLAYIEQHRLYR